LAGRVGGGSYPVGLGKASWDESRQVGLGQELPGKLGYLRTKVVSGEVPGKLGWERCPEGLGQKLVPRQVGRAGRPRTKASWLWY